MKSLSPLLALLIAFIMTACEEKSEPNLQTIPEATPPTQTPKTTTKKPPLTPRTFVLRDVDERDLEMTLKKNKIIFKDIEQPLVLLNFFATWSPPCKGELPDITQLQRDNQKDLFVIGILVNDELSSKELRAFMKRYSTNFFISYVKANKQLAQQITKRLGIEGNFPIPLSVLYKNGEFFRYYEGAAPIEIMQSELKQALKQPKENI